jgi:diamine N-acetyltransferase
MGHPGLPGLVSGSRVRPARAGDVPALVPLARETFLAAHVGATADDQLRVYTAESFSAERFAAALWGPESMVLVTESDGGAVMAFAWVDWAEPHPASVAPPGSVPPPAYLSRLYVALDRTGSGAGAALLEEAWREVERRGLPALWLRVWVGNPRAIAFYERHGFCVVETRSVEGFTPPPVVRLMLRTPDIAGTT